MSGAAQIDLEDWLETFEMTRPAWLEKARATARLLLREHETIHINMVRDQGLRQAQPLIEGAWADEAERQLTARWPEPPVRVHHGRNAQPASPSLPGFAQPDAAPADPLAVIAREVAQKAAARKAKRAAMRKKLKAGS